MDGFESLTNLRYTFQNPGKFPQICVTILFDKDCGFPISTKWSLFLIKSKIELYRSVIKLFLGCSLDPQSEFFETGANAIMIVTLSANQSGSKLMPINICAVPIE